MSEIWADVRENCRGNFSTAFPKRHIPSSRVNFSGEYFPEHAYTFTMDVCVLWIGAIKFMRYHNSFLHSSHEWSRTRLVRKSHKESVFEYLLCSKKSSLTRESFHKSTTREIIVGLYLHSVSFEFSRLKDTLCEVMHRQLMTFRYVL